MNARKSVPGFIFFCLLLAFSPAVSAQSSGTSVPGAITVTGEGTATAPAESALVVISLGADTNGMYDPATGMPIEGAATPQLDATPVVDAMVAYGVPVNDISVEEAPFTGEWGSMPMPMPIMIIATIPQPTVENLSGLLDVVREAAATGDLFVNQFGVMYSVADCRPLRQEARGIAVENARLEVDDQAAALNVTAGEVVASRDVMPMSGMAFQANSCNTTVPMKALAPIYMAMPFDPRMPAEVSVTIAVEISYAIP